MVHEHTYFDPTTGGAFQGCKDGFGLLVAAGREIFEMDELLGSINVCGDARKDGVVLGEQFDGIACNGGQLAQAGVQFDERLVTRRDLRIEHGSQLRLHAGLRHQLADEFAHRVLLGAAAFGELRAAQQQEDD